MDSEDSDDDFPAVTFTCSPAEPRGPPSLNPTAEEFYTQAEEAVPEVCEPPLVEDEQAHTAALDDSAEEAAGVDEVSSGDEIIETELRDPYPKRQRRHPQTLTYDRLGQPHFTERIVSTQGIDVRGYWRPW
ncbi:unnamed protein product [Gadus morhua 'NCC']|jgi:hypothetical protein